MTSYLCETGFSTVAILKAKYKSRLILKKELRTTIFSMIPRFEKICAEKQAQALHWIFMLLILNINFFCFIIIFLIKNILYS